MVLVAANTRHAARRERRGALRRRFCLDAEAQIHAGAMTPVVLHELSRSGFLMETSESLRIGDRLQIRLPERGPVFARVVWSCGRHLGCEFQRPLSSGAVSAALLKARPIARSESPPLCIRLGQQNTMVKIPANPASGLLTQFRFVLAFSVLLWAAAAALIFYTQ